MKNQSMKHSESGRTMLEMLGVLGIMGIIMYGAIAGINYGMSTYKINQTYNEVQEAIQAIQDLYSWSRCYPDGEFTSTVNDNDIFPSDTIALGTTRSVTGANEIDSCKNSFILKYEGVDGPSCNRLKEMDWSSVGMGIGGGCDSIVCAEDDNTLCFCPKDADHPTCDF